MYQRRLGLSSPCASFGCGWLLRARRTRHRGSQIANHSARWGKAREDRFHRGEARLNGRQPLAKVKHIAARREAQSGKISLQRLTSALLHGDEDFGKSAEYARIALSRHYLIEKLVELSLRLGHPIAPRREALGSGTFWIGHRLGLPITDARLNPPTVTNAT